MRPAPQQSSGQALSVAALLQQAWDRRVRGGFFVRSSANRVFHGPGEAEGHAGGLASLAIDRFAEGYYWVTCWQSCSRALKAEIVAFLVAQGATSVVALARPLQGVGRLPETWWGEPGGLEECLAVFECQATGGSERGVVCRYRIRWDQKTRHPGLFLDHAPLRQWLMTHSQGARVLNTFCYSGSLSIAALLGGAQAVDQLDLAKSALEWAKDNYRLNELPVEPGRFLHGDVFEWFPRFAKKQQQWDTVILDPPSFAQSKKGTFAVTHDLTRLIGLAVPLVAPGGCLIASINSSQVSVAKFQDGVRAALGGVSFQLIKLLDLPETFPTLLQDPASRYLKGCILRRRG